MEERDHLRRQLEDSLHELETLRVKILLSLSVSINILKF